MKNAAAKPELIQAWGSPAQRVMLAVAIFEKSISNGEEEDIAPDPKATGGESSEIGGQTPPL